MSWPRLRGLALTGELETRHIVQSKGFSILVLDYRDSVQLGEISLHTRCSDSRLEQQLRVA